MSPDRHAAKAERIERSLQKLSAADYEALIEGCMLAGTHWFNMALHKLGIAKVEEDALHAEFLSGALHLKLKLIDPEMLAALDEIESCRPRFVRGSAEGGEAAGRRCLQLLDLLRNAAERAQPFWAAHVDRSVRPGWEGPQ